MNKKAYITPDFEVIDMQTENLIAASNITIDKGDGDAPGRIFSLPKGKGEM